MNGFETNRTLSPVIVRKCQVMKNARPTEDVSTSGDLGRIRRIQTNWTWWHIGGLESNLFHLIPLDHDVRFRQMNGVIGIWLHHKLTAMWEERKTMNIYLIKITNSSGPQSNKILAKKHVSNFFRPLRKENTLNHNYFPQILCLLGGTNIPNF